MCRLRFVDAVATSLGMVMACPDHADYLAVAWVSIFVAHV